MDDRDAAVDVRVLQIGYQRACKRLNADRWERLSMHAFTSLFEALNWAVVIDDFIREHWTENGRRLGWRWRQRVPNGALMDGVRFARNRVHHQWAMAISLEHLPATGAHAPRGADEPPFAWAWRSVEDLPSPHPEEHKKLGANALAAHEHGHAMYKAELAGQPVRATLAGLNDLFAVALSKAGFHA